MQKQFKEGDRVAYHNLDNEDTGIVVAVDGSIYHEYCPDEVWVRWSNGEILWMGCKYLELTEDHKNTKTLTIETCLGFLTSEGFEVTLKKSK